MLPGGPDPGLPVSRHLAPPSDLSSSEGNVVVYILPGAASQSYLCEDESEPVINGFVVSLKLDRLSRRGGELCSFYFKCSVEDWLGKT